MKIQIIKSIKGASIAATEYYRYKNAISTDSDVAILSSAMLRVSELGMAEESMATSESVDIAFLYR
jgi:hypothetical protein